MSWYVADAIDRSVERTKKCLLEPFDFWKWMKLAIMVLFIGGAGFNGGSGGNYSFDESDISSVPATPAGATDIIQQIDSWAAANLFEIAFVLILLFVFFLLLFTFISSVMEFVFVESLVKNDVRFWEYSRRYLGKGLGLFLLRLLIGLFMLIIIAAISLPFIYSALDGSAANVPDFPESNVFLFLLLLFAIILVLVVAGSLISSFIGLSIPVALYTGNNIFRALSMVLRKFRQDAGQIVLYWIGRIVLSIAAAIVVGILALVIIVAAVLIVLVIDGLLYLAITTLLPESILVWIVLVPLIFIQFILFILALAFVSMPAQVFLRYHLLTFLQVWYPEITIPVFDGLKGAADADVQVPVQDAPL
jgi:hypothetical protein